MSEQPETPAEPARTPEPTHMPEPARTPEPAQTPQAAQIPGPPYEPGLPPQPQPAAVPPQAPDGQQWIPVAPPHPYATQQPQRPAGGKGLAIAAMALGLVALLTAIVSSFYFSFFAIGAAIAGLVAAVLGIVALIKRGRPRGAAIAGLVSGVLAMLLALLLGALGAVALAVNLFGGIPGSGEGSGQTGESWTPDTPNEALLAWPANMATGGVVLTGPGNPRPVTSQPLAAGDAPQTRQVDRQRSNDLLIYVDYRCPHCLVFEQTNGAYLEQLLSSGKASVEIVPLTFLDRSSMGTYYSSRAAGAVACLTDSQPQGVWRGHNALLSPQVQPGGGPGLTNDEIVSAIDRAVGGLNPEARDCIQTSRFASFADALSNWALSNPVPNAVQSGTRVSGTPEIFVNGERYEGKEDDAAEFKAFVERLLR